MGELLGTGLVGLSQGFHDWLDPHSPFTWTGTVRVTKNRTYLQRIGYELALTYAGVWELQYFFLFYNQAHASWSDILSPSILSSCASLITSTFGILRTFCQMDLFCWKSQPDLISNPIIVIVQTNSCMEVFQ